jgi:phosphatidylglycerol---prolipoprotein diacylglyceryl transferase
MHPELFSISFLHLRSYGLLLVIGFIAAVTVIRWLSRDFTVDPQHITNAALYSLIAGVIGSRLFFVIHYYNAEFRDQLWKIPAIWIGGLELLGGVFLAVPVIIFYIWHHRLPMRHYLDALAIGLLAALAFGRIGCFLNGCCYGKPADVAWAVQFPYGSFAYRSQVKADPLRNRDQPRLHLPPEYFGYRDKESGYTDDLKPESALTPLQLEEVKHGRYRCLPVHPTQLYESGGAVLLGLFLYLVLRRSRKAEQMGQYPLLTKPGSVFSLMFVFYGILRFIMEALRDDNPFEIDHLTISQLLGMGLVVLGLVCVVFFTLAKPEQLPARQPVPSAESAKNTHGKVRGGAGSSR